MARLKSSSLKDMVKATSKYHSKKVIIDGIKFDSKKEGDRYIQLKLLKNAGLIKDLELQKSFQLQPTFKKNGKTYRKISYIADFCYFDIHLGKYIVEDVKGFKTKEYALKKKMFEYVYKDLELIEV